ncbi:glycosyl transferase, family 2 [Crocosphaera subtropica ATCC 51142]|uniref:Glycosyl transferase, family 2 n=1 Tax=Crocosphaera subtropica (strain ATCC 51142 / BH68) TaxID=43989 RepID=B1WWE4_CROS5|nr:glycosyltransferase family 2 protein [Crocosphaera subtropica]ACB54072.1 glycosyl transferase, family 2 [Crocosphaera subtropica ATCC 51142]
MDLAIVIINYRTPHLVIDCLQSLQPQIDSSRHRVLLVDNNSGDDSVPILEQAIEDYHWKSWVNLIPSPVNGGFSAGNNMGMKAVTAKAYLLLNSDTIVRPGAIASLENALNKHPEAGLISPRLEWPDETPQISCFRYHSPLSQFIDGAATGLITKLLNAYNVPISVRDTPFEPQWTSFACVLIRQEVIKEIGFMDEGYFMYFDDIDYCRRARNAGWTVLHWPDARVVHLRGGSGSVKSEVAARKRPRPYLYASRSRYFAKFYGRFGLWVTNFCWLLGRSIAWIRELINNKQPHTCQYQEQDIWMNWKEPLKLPILPASNHEKTA